MIGILSNSFLKNPIPIQLTLNYCSHECSYCFANLNNPKRRANIKATITQLKNFEKKKDIQSFYLREKYPVLISNNYDPFSKNNYKQTLEVIKILKGLGIPVQLNTRGGYGTEEVIEVIDKSLFIISVPYSDEQIRQKIEPNSTSLNHRYELAKELIKKGHKVIIGINPFNSAFCKDHTEIMAQYKEIGIKYFWVNKLHLTNKQQKNLRDYEKEALTESLLKEAAKNIYTENWISQYKKCKSFAEQNGLEIVGTPSGFSETYFDECYSVYKKVMPVQNDFFKWLEKNKEHGEFIYFDEFYNFFNPLIPKIETDISKYIFQKANIKDKSFFQKTNFANILNIYWDSAAGLKLAEQYPIFSWAKKQYANKLDYMRDSENNRILIYHPMQYNTKDFMLWE